MGTGAAPLQIRLLGGLRLIRDEHDVVLPPSKKTRALLGYLIATGHPHRRERLCALLWDGPDDPRGELRWSVSKLRPLLNEGDNTTRVVADREFVGFVPERAEIDLASVRSLLHGGIPATPIEYLEQAAGLFRGELLDGLDLPICYRYQEWCMAEREAASRLHQAILTTLVARLDDQPDRALPYARALVTVNPLAETGHATIMRLLGRLGQKREALIHYDHARRILETELGATPGEEITTAYRNLQGCGVSRPRQASAPTPRPLPDRPHVPRAVFVGRCDERELIDQIVARTCTRQPVPTILVTGEPGIGKSHLLAHVESRGIAAGGIAFGARAFEAEAARPYGIWIDLLRTIVHGQGGKQLPPELGRLIPELGAPAEESGDRARLFDGVVDLLRQMSNDQPVVVALDDLQWIDEASSSLLHYVVRQFDAPAGVLFAIGARTGEITDNTAAASVIRSLGGDGRLHQITLTALSAVETAQLVSTVAPGIDPDTIYAVSTGNPLYSLELARARARGDPGTGQTIEHLVAERLARLRDRGRDLLVWAAALNRSFTPEEIARVAGLNLADLLVGLDDLERYGLIRPIDNDSYDFSHDLIRDATYRSISQPRRTLVHRQIARVLMATGAAELAADAAHHAALGNAHDLAARACIGAGDYALRFFANGEASGFAERGARHAHHLPSGPRKVETEIALLNIRILAALGPGMRPLPPIADEVVSLVAAAEALGLHASAATGHYLLSVLYQEAGDQSRAETSTLRAAQAGRITDDATRVNQLANTARCLLELETQVSRARALIDEAEAIAHAQEIERCELRWARGLVQRWDGEPVAASRSLQRALTLARHTEDRRREYKCLTWLAVLSLERGHFRETRTHALELIAIAEKTGVDDTPFAMALKALAGLPVTSDQAHVDLDVALRQLRAIDDKSYLAYALNAAAGLLLRAGELESAADHAREALAVAAVMRRTNEITIARALLARIGDDAAAREIDRLGRGRFDRNGLSARARAAVLEAAAIGHRVPTAVSTVVDQS
ncbi:MAG: AAA family ATPase [Chloroflexota bacterium]|nr:AAA family ATPase [Chloroflexota bacterium]